MPALPRVSHTKIYSVREQQEWGCSIKRDKPGVKGAQSPGHALMVWTLWAGASATDRVLWRCQSMSGHELSPGSSGRSRRSWVLRQHWEEDYRTGPRSFRRQDWKLAHLWHSHPGKVWRPQPEPKWDSCTHRQGTWKRHTSEACEGI